MHNPMLMTSPVLTDATKPMRTIGNYMRQHVLGRAPANAKEADVMFLSGWYCFLGHITEELNPELGNEFLNGVMHHPIARRLPRFDANELIVDTVECLEEDEEFHNTVSLAAEDCASSFHRQYPDRDFDEIAHVSFDPKARTVEFQLG